MKILGRLGSQKSIINLVYFIPFMINHHSAIFTFYLKSSLTYLIISVLSNKTNLLNSVSSLYCIVTCKKYHSKKFIDTFCMNFSFFLNNTLRYSCYVQYFSSY
jgi:hypothetical protein